MDGAKIDKPYKAAACSLAIAAIPEMAFSAIRRA